MFVLLREKPSKGWNDMVQWDNSQFYIQLQNQLSDLYIYVYRWEITPTDK